MDSCVKPFVDIFVTGIIPSRSSLDSASHISADHETSAVIIYLTLIAKDDYSMHPIFSICVSCYQPS